MKNQTPFALCLIGGILLLASHFTGGINTIFFLWVFLNNLAVLDPYIDIINIILFILFLIAWSGGAAVIVGGLLLTTSFVRLGKFIIAIAAGFGLISLILIIIWVVLVYGWAALLLLGWLIINIPWALGLVLTVIARSSAD
ncbi:MAG: hypothetical protein RTV31_08110 [Candidatus Thorarchaeota archaeon]